MTNTTRRRVAPLLLAGAALAVTGCASLRGHRPTAIRHVFIIVLENTGYDTTFGPGTRAPYLADSMVKRGALLRQYYGTGHFSLDNYIAMISGIAPTLQTQSDCPHYDDFVQTGTAPQGQPIGTGCVYPAHVPTIANQLAATHRTWKAYMEDMGNDPAREPARCGHGTVGQLDVTERASVGDQYAAKHDPFVYFHAIIDSASCQQNVVPLTELADALRSTARTPNYVFISPNLCHDGHDRPCVNGEPGGLVSADAFLQHWVPLITGSPAFRADGLLIVTFDEALSIDATACCNEPTGPNTTTPGFNGPGGGRIGAVLLSPYIAPGTISDVPYNHYSMLRSVEDAFGLPHLGYAGAPGLRGFGADVYTRRGGTR
ncbi:MAG TPA: alkaline phosphatase family protein [Gemmatimonadaceae bacterium]|nr:alkaline phosphatase family protein [Gemmatimonadaceae bacterium]